TVFRTHGTASGKTRPTPPRRTIGPPARLATDPDARRPALPLPASHHAGPALPPRRPDAPPPRPPHLAAPRPRRRLAFGRSAAPAAGAAASRPPPASEPPQARPHHARPDSLTPDARARPVRPELTARAPAPSRNEPAQRAV